MAAAPTTAGTTIASAAPGEMRIAALDGFRGVTTLMVVVSHFFAELHNGIKALAVGWMAVLAFFVLSGFLIGRLILEKQVHANFYTVFYVRRVCRMIPPFVVVLLGIYGLYAVIGHHHWAETTPMFPMWSYLTFTQGFFMISTDTIGPHWLAPTWTLAVEEHFYLIAPAAIILTPRRHLLKVLVAVALMSVAIRYAIFIGGIGPNMAGRVMIFSLADSLIAGIIAAELYVTKRIDWAKHGDAIRVAPIVLLLASFVIRFVDDNPDGLFAVFGTHFISIAAACVILSLMYGAPEAKRFENKTLCFFGHTSYTVYLTHLAVLGMMHGLILGDIPDLLTWQQFLVTLAALPVAFGVGWVLYRFIEEPMTAYGRSWRWSKELRPSRADAARPAVVNV
ncbi:MAG TPA: acyltransferase [Hyphomicrobiaceae bacterium]|nr:acyltransferase [Hyphomicrobiaceae bacterium]